MLYLITGIFKEPDNDEDIWVITQARDLFQKCLSNGGGHKSGDSFIRIMKSSLCELYGRGLQTEKPFPPRREKCAALIFEHFRIALLHKLLQQNYKGKLELEDLFTEVSK